MVVSLRSECIIIEYLLFTQLVAKEAVTSIRTSVMKRADINKYDTRSK